MFKLSVILPTYNPDYVRLSKTLKSLELQLFSQNDWELILIDNNSSNDVISQCIKESKISNLRVVHESRQGLTWARLKGFEESNSDIVIMVDDDNDLNSSYLENALSIMCTNTKLGAIGGMIHGNYEVTPPEFIHQIDKILAIRNLGQEKIIYLPNNFELLTYPECAPVGAGMVLRKNAIAQYCKNIKENGSEISDRNGANLSSGGDNDIVINVIKAGYGVAYFPDLSLKHLIPAGRLKVDYLAKLNHASSKSWSQLLLIHGISPWSPIPKWTLLLRKIKAFFLFQPWKSALRYIQWKGVCGHFEGRVQSRK